MATLLGTYYTYYETSGTNTPNPYSDVRWYFQVYLDSQSVANNTSKVYAKAYVQRSTSGQMSFSTYAKTTIDGTAWTSATQNFSKVGAGTTLLGTSSTKTITHGSDGKKSFSFFGQGYGPPRGAGPHTIALPQIPRASSFTFTSDGFTGSQINVSITRADSSFVHDLWWRMGSGAWQKFATDVGTSTSFTVPHSALPNNPPTGTMTIALQTKSGGTNIGGEVWDTKVLTVPSNIIPTIGSISRSETVTAVNNLSLGADKYVQNKSRVAITINSPSAGSGATISSYKITFAGQTLNASSGTTQVITQSGTLPIICTITDSRGRSTSKTQNVTVYPYSAPRIDNFSVYRSDSLGNRNPAGTYAVLDIKVSASSVDNKNTLSYQMQRRNAGSGTFTNVGSLKTGNPISDDTPVISDVTQDYDLRVVLTDVFGTVNITDPTLYVPRAGVNFFAGSQGTGSGFGIIPGKTYDLEIGTRGLYSHGKVYSEGVEVVIEVDNYTSGDTQVRKYSNGVMTMWYRETINTPISNAYGSLYIEGITWTYPEPFSHTPFVSPGTARHGKGASFLTLSTTTTILSSFYIVDAYTR